MRQIFSVNIYLLLNIYDIIFNTYQEIHITYVNYKTNNERKS